METATTTYDDRPISMYDNLNMTNNVNTTSTPKTKHLQPPSTASAHMMMTPMQAAAKKPSPALPPSKANGAAHSTPFADIAFKFNDNNNTKTQSPLTTQYQQPPQPAPVQVNGNRNLNQISKPSPPPNTANSLYATPFKMANTAIAKPAITTATTSTPSPPPQVLQSLASPPSASASIGNALSSSSITAMPSTTSSLASPSSSSSKSPLSASALAPLAMPAAANSIANDARLHERPLSQHSQSELNETSHNIAAVKAALNEAKSKFFGLNGYAQHQQPHQHHSPYEPHESQMQNLLPNNTTTSPRDNNSRNPQQQQQHHQPTSHLQPQQKPQPKYQNIPENSALFRSSPKAGVDAPALPPKPVEYQNLNTAPATTNTTATTPTNNNNKAIGHNSPMDHHSNHRKLPDGTTYNQISLNDIDGPSHRSQTVYMATTVPQNIKGNKIAGRHTPTRSSLRHSRMLVVSNKHFEEIKHPNPMGFRQPNLARWLLILQIIIGILLLSLSTWIFVLSPNTPIQDNPYWSGLVLLIAGIIGLILIRYHRIKRDKTREHCFIFLRMDSYVLALLSLLLCCVALIFAAIHYCRITAPDTRCESVHMLIEHGSCVCTFNAPPLNDTSTTNSTESLASGLEPEYGLEGDNLATDNSYKFEYRDLSCDEVSGPWTTILGLSFIVNSVGFVISLVYIILLACCRSAEKRSYTTVRTSTF
ncbi:mucin-2 isoform X1 [Stomoxys calcitrans]|uniref:mucin-2 isoform X1 n=1 Tax=Stomoxys calcitrans TaxID=35570 RepID=UPI0027E24F7F|nr:mucin-2 isoform X1 [Stomoxys calcitrans]XP_013118885.2 mucin-2 isoform X1 [Stomoxys calcitrans]